MQKIIFSSKNIEQFSSLVTLDTTKDLKSQCHQIGAELQNTFANTIVKQIGETSLIHVQFAHPLNMKAGL